MSDDELADLQDCIKIVVRHITDGNSIENKVVDVMGGVVYETASERIRREVFEQLAPQIDAAKEELASYQQKADEAKQKADKAEQKAERYKALLIENGISFEE